MLLRNARISGAGDVPVDMLLEGGVIHTIGPVGMVPDTSAIGAAHRESVDLDGRWVTPGLWDNHVHFSQYSLQSQRLDVSAARSAAEVAHRMAEAFDSDSPSPLIGVGFRDGLWPDAPNVPALDAVCSAPVVVVSGDLHSVWLNTAALARYGHPGHPTGLLREDDAFRVIGLLDSVSEDDIDAAAAIAAAGAASRGLVGIVDYEMTWNLGVWERRYDAGLRSLRVEFGIYTEFLDRAIEIGLRTGDRVNDLITVGNYKVLTDGSLNTRTAYNYDEYPGLEGTDHSHGMLVVPTDRLVPLMRKAASARIRSSVHAIGDHANTIALDAFEVVGGGGRIEHAQLVTEADLPRFARLGVAASVQPDHAMDDRDVAEKHWAGKTDRAFPLRSLLEAGATLLLGSDAPVSPLDPWSAIAAAVGRSRDGRAPWHPEQSISAAQAIAASTRSTVSVGQPADLVVTDRDPLDAGDPTTSTVDAVAAADRLRSTRVVATLLAGEFTHRTI
jgi:predicted amidohydrolase YtcJ